MFFNRKPKPTDAKTIIEAATDRMVAERDMHMRAAASYGNLVASLEIQLANARKCEADHTYLMTQLNGLLMETVNAEFVPYIPSQSQPVIDFLEDAGLADELDDALTNDWPEGMITNVR